MSENWAQRINPLTVRRMLRNNTPKAVAAQLRCDPSHIYRLCRRYEIPYTRTSGKRPYIKPSVDTAIA